MNAGQKILSLRERLMPRSSFVYGATLTYFLSLFIWIVFYFLPPAVSNIGDLLEVGFFWPKHPYVQDWSKELGYLNIIEQSFNIGQLPWVVESLPLIVKSNEQFLGFPFFTWLPHLMLLNFLTPFDFHLLNHLLAFTIGFHGCLIARHHWSLSGLAFFFLFITLNFYGGFALKVAAYGPSMMGYYLSIHILVYLMQIKDQEGINWSWKLPPQGVKLAFVLALTLYFGSVHFYVQWITFIIFWGLINWRSFPHLILVGLLTVVFSASRLFPAAVSFGTASNPRDVYGYHSLHQLFKSFFEQRVIVDEPFFAWWEYSNFITYIGLGIVILFAISPYLKAEHRQDILFKSFFIPLVLIVFISFENYRLIFIPQFIPLLNTQSLTTRYMFIPVLILVLLACVNFSTKQKSFEMMEKTALWLAMIVHTAFLAKYMVKWRLQEIENIAITLMEPGTYVFSDPTTKFENFANPATEFDKMALLANSAVQLLINDVRPDTLYAISFWSGHLVTFIAISATALIFWLRCRKAPKPSKQGVKR